MSQDDKAKALDALYQDISRCRGCRLCQTRTHTVPGEGNPYASVMLVGEGPGEQEDRQGRPFVGPAGQLLDRMLFAAGIARDDIYISNVVKCRPPGNINPRDDEAQVCINWLRQQVRIIRPRIIICMGSVAVKHLLDPSARVSHIRGNWIDRKGVRMMATYHPAALLRNETLKIEAWQDWRKIRDALAQLEGSDER